MGGEAVLRLDGVDVGYRRRARTRVVLSGVTATVRASELVCLVGPNGTGKSTLLRSIVKLQPVLAGTIHVSSIPIDRLNRRQMADRSQPY